MGWLSWLTVNYWVVGAAAAALNLGATAVLVRAISVERFGLVDLVRTSQFLLATALSLNVFQSASRFCLDTTEREAQRTLLGGGLVAHVTASCAAGVGLLALYPVGERVLGLSLDPTTLWLAAAGIPFGSLADALVQTTVLRGAPGRYAALVLSQAGLTLAGVYVFVFVLGLDVSGYFLALLLTSVVIGAGGCWLLEDEYRWCWPRGSLRRHLRFGAPFTVAALIQYAFAFFSRVSLLRLASPETLGLYGLAERAQTPMTLAVAAAGRAWLPWLLTERPAPGRAVKGPVRELSGLVLAVLGGMMIFLKDLLGLFGGERYGEAYGAAVVLLVAAWVYFVGDWIVSGTLSLVGQTQYRIWIFGMAYGVAAAITPWTIAWWGSTGVAIAVFVACAGVLLGMLAVSTAVHPLNHGLSTLLPISAALIALALWGSVQSSGWYKAVLLAAYVALLWRLGLLRAWRTANPMTLRSVAP